MRTKTRAFILTAALAGCTYNTYETGDDNSEEPVEQINTCEGVINKYFACGLNELGSDYDRSDYSDYSYLVSRCKDKGWLLNTEWKSCFEANSCKDLSAGICEQYSDR